MDAGERKEGPPAVSLCPPSPDGGPAGLRLFVTAPEPRTSSELKHDEDFKVRAPWGPAAAAVIAGSRRIPQTSRPKYDRPSPNTDVDADGALMPPVANKDLPRQLERDASFMVLGDELVGGVQHGSDSDSDDDSAVSFGPVRQVLRLPLFL
jgi:hypothetical protein